MTGRLTSGGQALAGVTLALRSDPYPFRRSATVAHVTSSSDGSFSFPGIRPDRNTRLRVVSEGSTAVSAPPLVATVDPKLSSSARSLGPGRVRLTLHARHAITGDARSVSAWWFLSARASRVFRLAAVTATRELSPGVTYASVIVDPPVRRFVYRICINPPWEKAMGPAATHRRCPEASFVAGAHER
ncbi:MAG TPA: carboxypeptidase-like regulatory domain-containing protein [Solirubrobacteraceae bacterium]|nr:carboxypeptidase-like regulatory domain-containing protein [Solirubrobacteraceae bacterium]